MLDLVVLKSVVAGLVASLACGLGVLPLLLPHIDPRKHTGLGYAFAAGLMFAASVYNLILPGLHMVEQIPYSLLSVSPVIGGLLLGALTLWASNRAMNKLVVDEERLAGWGGRTSLMIFIAMSIHSAPEGVAVGVGYASERVLSDHAGLYIALAIALHNIPEGLAVAIPMRAAGARITTCFLAAFLTSLPQPVAAIPASILAWFFQPLMPLLMGFAAGAMIFLVLQELIPDALEVESPAVVSWCFLFGFCGMLLLQIVF